MGDNPSEILIYIQLKNNFQKNASEGASGCLISKNLFIKSYSKSIEKKNRAEELFQKNGKQSQRPFLNCFVWKMAKETTNKKKLFKEKVSVMLKVQFFVVRVLFFLNQGFKSKLLITTCQHFFKLHFSTPKMSHFLILNWDGRLTRTEQLIDFGLNHLITYSCK